MRNCYLLRLSPRRRVSACLFALPILILAFADSVFAQTSAGPTAPVSTPGATQPPSRQSLEDWHRGMVKVAPPKKGCFTSSYPSTQWQEVPCTTAPAGPYLPARGPRLTTTAGNGFDVVAQVTGHISEAIGSFDSLTGVTSESGSGASPFGGPNSFSLQLNSNFFPNPPACTGGAATCKGWVQFIFSNSACSATSEYPACTFIENWLLGYGKTTCPPGWKYFNNAGDDQCYFNSPAIPVPQQSITNLINLSLRGEAAPGGNNTVIMAVGGSLYSVPEVDGSLNLSQFWQEAEFNIVGDGGGSQANFNPGSTIVVRTSVDSGTSIVPACGTDGTTGETNNLNFVSTPAAQKGSLPAIVFAESNTGVAAISPCDSVVKLEGITRFYQQAGPLIGTGRSSTRESDEGFSVALSADGNTAIVGGPGDNYIGAVWIFTRSGGSWTQEGPKLVGTGYSAAGSGSVGQGTSVALSADGNTAIVGGPRDSTDTGAAWVFTRSGGVWTQQGPKLVGTGSSNFSFVGTSVALSADGNTAIVGGSEDNSAIGAAWIFTRSSAGVWTQQGLKLVGTGVVKYARQGGAVALSADGNTAIVGGYSDNSNLGAAWVWTRNGGVWTQQGPKLVGTGNSGSNSSEGFSVALSADGNTAIVGGYSDNSFTGAAWIFTRNAAGVWTQQGSKLIASDYVGAAFQGNSVALSSDGNIAVVGGPQDNGARPVGNGAAWVWTRSGGVWTQQGPKRIGSSMAKPANQGFAVALSGDGSTLLIGAPIYWNGVGYSSGAVSVFFDPTAPMVTGSNVAP
jgi:hypothetical protein